MYQFVNSTSIKYLPSGVVFPMAAGNMDYEAFLQWIDGGNTPEPAPVPPVPTQFELDRNRYVRRAEIKNELLADMAAENMARVRAGTWTVGDLTALMSDPVSKQVLELINTLSFEMAASLLATASHPLLTPEIRAGWAAKLQAHFYLVP